MSSNVLCRYFAQGACAFGDKCRFSHNKQQDEPSQVCRYYLAGNCAYGDNCRYQHSKPGWSGKGQAAAAQSHPYSAPSGVPRPSASGPNNAPSSSSMVKLPSGASEFGMVEGAAPNWDDFMTPDEMDEFDQWQAEQAIAASNGVDGGDEDDQEYGYNAAGGGGGGGGDIMDPADIPLCNEFAGTGGCSAGEECCYIHGDQCQVCQQYVLDPSDPQRAAEHVQECTQLAAKLAKRVRDSSIECGICLEKIMSKAEMSSRRFGLMACEHAFCLGCIRNWRAVAEVDARTALRTCPICRTPTHFITPSTTWPDSPADKAAIVDAYKASMADKDCIHFDHGDGSCPFGTSCFYRHAYRDGRLEEVQLRRAGNADGDVKVLAPVTLSSFLEASLTAQLALSSSSRRPRAQQRGQQQRGRQQQQQQQQQQHEEQQPEPEEQEQPEEQRPTQSAQAELLPQTLD